MVAIESFPTNLDPRYATDAYSERIGQILFSRLVRIDNSSQVVPDLAERWEIEEEGRRYTFHLRKGVAFHDGSELTSADVRYTFESIRDPAVGSPHRKGYDVIERIETPDPRTIRFVLRSPHAPLLVSLSRGIVPELIARKEGKDFGLHPIGSGPFAFVRMATDEFIELVGNPLYYDGPPEVPRLLFRTIPEDTVRLLELEKGTVDLILNALPPDLLDRIRRNPSLSVSTAPGTNYVYLGFNLTDPVLKERRVRKAFAYAIDRPVIIKNILRGLAEPATGLLSTANWAYNGRVRRYDYDPAEAKRLLDEAGYRDPDGDGPKMRLRVIHKTSQNDLARRVAEVLQEQLARVGIGVDIRTYEWATFYSDIKSGNFQMFTLSWVGVFEPDIFYYLFHSESVPPDGANRGRYSNPELDRLVEKGRISDLKRRREIYARVQEILADDLPYVPLWYTMNVLAARRGVTGFQLTPAGDFYSLREVEKSA